MSNSSSTSTSEIDRFWDKYINFVTKQGVKQGALRWYVRRCEQYIASFPDKRLSAHTPDDVTNYLQQQGRSTKINDWQFRQMIDAIRNLFQFTHTPWASSFDWQSLYDASYSLNNDHASIARDQNVTQTIEHLMLTLEQERSYSPHPIS